MKSDHDRPKVAWIARILGWSLETALPNSGIKLASMEDVELLVENAREAESRDLLLHEHFGSVVLSATATDQLEVQRSFGRDVERSCRIFAGLDFGFGCELNRAATLVMAFANLLSTPLAETDLPLVFARLEAEARQQAIALVRLLTANLDARANGLASLKTHPIIRLRDGRLVCPIPPFLSNVLSPVGLFIRAIADPGIQHSVVGNMLGSYVGGRLHALKDAGWTVINIDERIAAKAKNPSRADFVVIPPDGTAVVILEVKTTLQTRPARNGDIPALNVLSRKYEEALGQILSSIDRFGTSDKLDLADVPTDLPVYGLVVTMERHFTVNLGGVLYPGLPVVVPPWSGVELPFPLSVVSVDELDRFIDSALVDPVGAVSAVVRSTTSGNPGVGLDEALNEFCGETTSSVAAATDSRLRAEARKLFGEPVAGKVESVG